MELYVSYSIFALHLSRMIDLLKKTFFSTKLTAFLLFVFLAAIGIATFIENDYGTTASKKVIYNAHWFELVIFILGINLVGNIAKFKLWRREKWPVFFFHLSWIIIILGAAVTRYAGYEGMMHIRQDESKNSMISATTFLDLNINDGKKQWGVQREILANDLYNSAFNYNVSLNDKDFNIKYVDFIPNAIDSVVTSGGGTEIVEIVTVGRNGRESVYLASGETKLFGMFPVSFNTEETENMAVKIFMEGNGLKIRSPYDIHYMLMDDQSRGTLKSDSTYDFKQRRLYSIGEEQLVFKAMFPNAELKKVPVDKDDRRGEDVLVINVSSGDESKDVYMAGGAGYQSPSSRLKINGMNFKGRYGAILYDLPFSIKLRDFELETYPGSSSPSSYASEVTLIDESENIEEDHRIFMNHVLDHRGYRFFQSSYDKDQLGTVLSVNHDFWGTWITYIGYFMMALGMIFTFITKQTRFNSLRKKLKKLRAKKLRAAVTILFFGFSGYSFGFVTPDTTNMSIPVEHANKFEQLIMQGRDGRFKPIQTFTSQLTRKLTINKKFKGLTPTQMVLGMMYDRAHWQQQKLIKLEHPLLAKELGAEKVKVGMTDYYFVSFRQMFDESGAYVLKQKIEDANRKPEKERSKYDKDVIKLDERINICFMIYNNGEIFTMFPNPKELEGSWYRNTELDLVDGTERKPIFEGTSRLFVENIIPLYLQSMDESRFNSNWSKADSMVVHLHNYQQKFGHHVLPSQRKIDMELKYNGYKFFNRSMGIYLLVGTLLLIISFFELFYKSKIINVIQWLFISILIATFIFHGVGLGMRWWISEHAPWSNAYEALTFIAWGTVLSGFLFVKSSRITMAATAILAGMTLFVAWLNWLNPEITNLEPVLKSYWLTIHVAVITSSYAFLGLAAILGIVNLILMIFRGKKNKQKLGDAINELTYVSEMTMTIGVFAAAIGTFLGGIWANESWGRYWGWDPKETWALVIVLTYAVVLHLRLVKGWTGKYLFNVSSVIAYSSVLMTFFGVNYYLSGLHSYAGGAAPPVPTFVLPTVIIIVVIAVLAYFRNNKLQNIK